MKRNIMVMAAMAALVSWTWAGDAGPRTRKGEGEGAWRGQERRGEMKREMGRAMPGEREGQGPMEGGAGGLEGGLILRLLNNERVVKELGLTEDQINGLKDNAQDIETQMQKLQAEMQEAAMHQAKLISEKTVNEDAVLEAVEAAGKIRTEMAKLRIRQLLMVRKLLTPEQLERLRNLRQERMRGREGGAGNPEARRERIKRRMEEGPGANREEIREHIRGRMEMRRKGGDRGREGGEGEGNGADEPGMENFRE